MVDSEAGGMYKFPSREFLKAEMDTHPEKFTDDLKHMVPEFWEYLVPLEGSEE